MRIAKAVIAGVGAIATVLTAAFADNALSFNETQTIALCIVEQVTTVIAVWSARNKGYIYAPEKYAQQQQNDTLN